jgi:hypothetical protein
LSFAACLLLAAKINEKNVILDYETRDDEDEGKIARLQSLVRPTKASSSMFASLLEFFAHDWSLSLKTVFAAEWGVFVVSRRAFRYPSDFVCCAQSPVGSQALGFSLHTTPSQVAFHFKRMMKYLEWSPLSYLGPEMYSQWIESLEDEAQRRVEHEKRKKLRQERKERKLLQLQRERLQSENDVKRRQKEAELLDENGHFGGDVSESMIPDDASSPSRAAGRKISAMKLFHRLALKKNTSMEKLAGHAAVSDHPIAQRTSTMMTRSPSLPVFAGQDNEPHVAIHIEENEGEDDISVGAVSDGGLMF